MARGRMLNKTICASKQFDDLPDDTCRLLATWIISNLDCRGVFYGDPAMVKSYVFPRRADVTMDQVTGYLETMSKVGLIVLFDAKGETWQYWPGFADNQIGLRAERERTTFPPPPGYIPQDDGKMPETIPPSGGEMPDAIPQDDGEMPAEVKLKEVNLSRREEKLIEVERQVPALAPADNSKQPSTSDFSTAQALSTSDSDKTNAPEAENDKNNGDCRASPALGNADPIELPPLITFEVAISALSRLLGDQTAAKSNRARAYNIWHQTTLSDCEIMACVKNATRKLNERKPRDPPLKKPMAYWFHIFEEQAQVKEREKVNG